MFKTNSYYEILGHVLYTYSGAKCTGIGVFPAHEQGFCLVNTSEPRITYLPVFYQV